MGRVPRCRGIECGGLRQDRALELSERAAGLDSEFDKLSAGLLVTAIDPESGHVIQTNFTSKDIQTPVR
jgi:hypothetical protein